MPPLARLVAVSLLFVSLAASSDRPRRAVASGPTPPEASPTTWSSLDADTRAGLGAAMRVAQAQRDSGALLFHNPDQQLHSSIDASATTIAGRDGTRVQFRPLAVGRGAAMVALSDAVPTGSGTTEVTLARQAGDVAVDEWWRNDKDGIEQGFTLRVPVPGTGDLLIAQDVESALTMVVTETGRGVRFLDGEQVRLQYDQLRAWDATGRDLPARLDVAGSRLVMVVDDAGATYPVTIDPTITQQAYLKPSNTSPDYEFGNAVAVSGDTIVVGAPREDSAATGVNGDQTPGHIDTNKGAAYVFTRSGNTWSQQAYLKGSGSAWLFGWAVAIDGDTVVVGAYPESDFSDGVGINGAAYVFTRSGSTWSQQAYLKASNPQQSAIFGFSVAVSGDTVIVGAPKENSSATGVNGDQANSSASEAGAAYVFTRSGGAWSQQAYLKASNTGAQDHFGWSVAISGDTAVVGAYQEDSNATGVNGDQANNSTQNAGAAYVFTRAGSTWSQQAYLKASNTGTFNSFGFAVAISGDTAVVGAYGRSAAYVFTRSGSTWSQQAFLTASSTSYFGRAVAISGNTVVVGLGDCFCEGAAYVFTRSGGTWSQQPFLKGSNTAASSDSFGSAVAVSGDTVVVGALAEDSSATGVNGNQADEGASRSGAAYTFQLTLTPNAPTGVGGVPGNGQVTVSFTAPPDSGGPAITDYTVTASPGGATASGPSSPIVVTGLTNGTPYTFTVKATNSAGTGPASSASAPITPNSAPTISAIANQTTGKSTPTSAIVFTVGDGETAAGSLSVSRSSSNTALVPIANIALGGSGANRTVIVTPAKNLMGSAAITVTVSDGALTASTTFTLTVFTANAIVATPAMINLAATKAGAAGALQGLSPVQEVTVTFPGSSAPWTAIADQPWVQITNGSGSSAGVFSVSVINPNNVIAGASSLTASLTVSAPALGVTTTIPVQLSVRAPDGNTAPFGSFDTPAAGSTVSGSFMVSGWALDDTGVTRVQIWRDPIAGETGQIATGPANGKIYIADAVFVSGARPDVETAQSGLPLASRAGWGYLLLSYGLPGNRAYTLHAFAHDADGFIQSLGSKAIVVNNLTATAPFGAIDTPAQGQRVSGGIWNFGWALTPNSTPPPCAVISVSVSIDSGPLVPVTYGGNRTDIAAGFPGYTNSASAGGAYYLDTTTLTNGTHTIGWYVVDSCNRASGIGSRFFSVLNAGSTTVPTDGVAAVSPGGASALAVSVRRASQHLLVAPNGAGTRVVRLDPGERLELDLPADAGTYVGYAVVGGERRALPIGSSLDAASGTFYWTPMAGFLGVHDLEFIGAAGNTVAVRVIIGTAVQAVIDTPAPGAVESSLTIAGWAIDEAAQEGTGIDAVHVWAYPAAGGEPIFLGVAEMGGERPDIAALFGDQFAPSSYSLDVTLAAGVYDVVVYPHSAVARDFHGAQVVRVVVP